MEKEEKFGTGKANTIKDMYGDFVLMRIYNIRDLVNGYLNGRGIINSDFTYLFMLAIKDDILHLDAATDYLEMFRDLDIASDIYGCIMNKGYLFGGVVLHFEQIGHEDLIWAIDWIKSKQLKPNE